MKDSSLDEIKLILDKVERRAMLMMTDGGNFQADDVMTIQQATQAIKELITKREREAEIKGLEYALGKWHTYSDGVSPRWSQNIKDRLEELNTSEGGE